MDKMIVIGKDGKERFQIEGGFVVELKDDRAGWVHGELTGPFTFITKERTKKEVIDSIDQIILEWKKDQKKQVTKKLKPKRSKNGN